MTHLSTKKHCAWLLLSSEATKAILPVSIFMFCAAAVWLRPHIELIVRGEVWPWGGTPTGSCIGRGAGAALLNLLHTGQVPWVKLGAEHNITEASLHDSEHWPFLPSGSSWSGSQRSAIDSLLWNQTNTITFTVRTIQRQKKLKLLVEHWMT